MLQTPRWLPLALLLALVPLVGWVFARTDSPVAPSQEPVSALAEAAGPVTLRINSTTGVATINSSIMARNASAKAIVDASRYVGA